MLDKVYAAKICLDKWAVHKDDVTLIIKARDMIEEALKTTINTSDDLDVLRINAFGNVNHIVRSHKYEVACLLGLSTRSIERRIQNNTFTMQEKLKIIKEFGDKYE